MATLDQTIQIIFDGVDNVGGVIDGVGQDLGNLSGAVQDVTGPLADITSNLLLFQGAAVGAGVALGALALAAADEFNTSFSEIATLTNATDEELSAFRQQLLDYGASSYSAFDQITSATYAAVSAGVAYGESVQFVSDAERLAIASKADLGDTTVLLASTLNAYGASYEEAARYSDAFFTTVRLGQTNLPQLAASMAQVTGSANALNIPIETLGAAIATLTSKGLPTAEAMTALKAAFSNIVKPSESAVKAAEGLGLEFSATAVQTQGLEGFLDSLSEATGGNIATLNQLFGSTEAVEAILKLTGGEAKKFKESLREMEDTAGAVDEAFARMEGNFDTFGNSLTALLITIGTGLDDPFDSILAAMSGVFNALRQSVDAGAFSDIYAAIDALALNIVGSLETLAQNIPEALSGVDFSGLLRATGSVGEAIADLFSGIDLSTPEGLRSAIQSVINVAEGLTDVTAGVVLGFGPFVDGIASAVREFSAMTPEARAASGEVLGFATAIDGMLGFADAAAGALQGIAAALSVIAGSQALTAIRGLAGALGAGGLAASAGAAGTALAGIATAWATFEFGRWIADVTGLDAAMSDLANRVLDAGETVGTSADALSRLPDALADINERTGVAVNSIDEFNAAVERGELVFDATAQQWVAAGQAMRDFDTEVEAAASSNGQLLLTQEELANAMRPVSGLLADAANSTGALADGADAASGSTGALVRTIYDAQGNIIRYEQAASTLPKAFKDTASATKEAADETEAYRLKLLELASDERIALIEAKVSLDIAELEAQTKQVEAAFASIDNTVTSSAELLGNLFGLYAGADSLREKFNLEDQIDLENKRRQEALDLQERLIEAEIRQIDARTRLLEKGGGEVKITSDGLEPALEAFMFSVIDKVRVSVASSYDDFLLGCSNA
jgi:TP901 family phage tail tape measure protein